MKQRNVVSDKDGLPGGHVFRLWSVHDVFGKLHREKQRFESAGSGFEGLRNQIDAAINFAITAWHMTDWACRWKEKEQFNKDKLHRFQCEVRRQCPDLAVCDVIANAAKHGGTADMKGNRPEIKTVLVADPVAEGALGVELYAEGADPEWSLQIHVNGKPEDLHAVFYRVFGFWHKFIQHYCVTKRASERGVLVEK